MIKKYYELIYKKPKGLYDYLDRLQFHIYNFFNIGEVEFHFGIWKDNDDKEFYYLRIYTKLSYYLKEFIWEYNNTWEYSFFGFLNFKWYKNFWYQIIYSRNGYSGWKKLLNDFCYLLGISRYLCKRKGWKY